MTLITVRSNAIHAIGYDQERLLLEIVFSNGGIYRYLHVPPQVFIKFVQSPSKGRFFQKYIRGSYSSERITKRKLIRNPLRRIEQSPAAQAP